MDWFRFIEDHEGSIFSPKMKGIFRGKAERDDKPGTLESWLAETNEKINQRQLARERIVASSY